MREWEKLKAANVSMDTRNILGAGVGAPNVCASCKTCKIVWYCGRECQRANWRVHKLECKYLAGTQIQIGASGSAGGSGQT